MTTDSLETPAACASEDLNAVCLSSVKADGDMGRERAIRTSFNWVQVLSDKAPVDVEDVPDWHLVHSAAPMLGENVPTGHACLSLANPGQ